MTPADRAQRAAQVLWENDKASQGLGIEIQEVGPEHAVLSMQVQDRFLNGHGICHGGFIFTLADSAFAFACNSGNQNTVAQQNQITFLSPGRAGESLVATCTKVEKTGRTGVYDVTVTGADGRTVAVMRGLSRTIKGTLFDEDSAQGA